MNKNNCPTVVLTNISKRWNYFQVFFLGFHQLEKEGKIKFKVRAGFINWLSFYVPHITFLERFVGYLNAKFNNDSYNTGGYVEQNGERKYFAIDSADAPYLFDDLQLTKVDKYFKMQCPKDINPSTGFRLTDDIYIPYCDFAHKDASITTLTTRGERKTCPHLTANLKKIKPALVGFRKLSRVNTYIALNEAFENYRKAAVNKATSKAMCYFGNARGPKPTVFHGEHPDWDWESDIMGYYADKISHPNEKRSFVGNILSRMGDGYDSRVICDDYADTSAKKREDLVVPLKDFCEHISHFQYNINVSGYRMSMPNRFMESFIVGTAVMTDKLAVKWYLPFDEEVVETVEMGYLPIDTIDWTCFEKDLKNLPEVDKKVVLKRFEEKWSPKKVVSYMINTMLE